MQEEDYIGFLFIDERSEAATVLTGHGRASEETKGLIPLAILPLRTTDC